MFSIDAPELLAAFGLIISSLIFYSYARGVNKEILTLDGFMLSDRNLNKSQFSNTFAASSFSLAMTTMFFFFNHKIYGLFLLVSPITYLLGQYLFVWLVNKSNVCFDDCRTISDLCYLLYPSRALAILITLMTLTSFTMIVFIELYIGTVVLTVFLPNHIFYQTLSFLFIGSLVLLYIRLGGYKALVKTDKWQLTLMLTSVTLIFIYGFSSPVINELDMTHILLTSLSYTESKWSLLGFIIWLSSLNLVLPFTQVSYWQRIAASKNTEISLKGLIHSSWKVLALFTLPILGFILLGAKGYSFYSFPEFLQTVKNTNWLSSYIIFPLLIVGFCSTVFSSADTAIIAMTYAITDKNTFLSKFTKMNEKTLRRTLTILIIAILIILSIIYWLQFAGLQDWLVPIIYTICGQLAILTPLPIYILIKLIKGKTIQALPVTRYNFVLLFGGIVIAWSILLIGTYLAKTTTSQIWTQLSTPLGALIIALALWIIQRKNAFVVKNNAYGYHTIKRSS